MIPLSWYLTLAAMLFVVGVFGFFLKRNIIALLLSIEVMLNGVNLTLVAFSSSSGIFAGQVLVYFTMVVAAAETAVGLALVIALFRNRQSLDVDSMRLMKW